MLETFLVHLAQTFHLDLNYSQQGPLNTTLCPFSYYIQFANLCPPLRKIELRFSFLTDFPI